MPTYRYDALSLVDMSQVLRVFLYLFRTLIHVYRLLVLGVGPCYSYFVKLMASMLFWKVCIIVRVLRHHSLLFAVQLHTEADLQCGYYACTVVLLSLTVHCITVDSFC